MGASTSQVTVRERPGAGWDEFVRARPAASIYLLSGWSLLARDVFGHQAFFIESHDAGGALNGVLPLVRQKSLLFGDFLTSIPFFNYGGALADTPEITQALMDQARVQAQSLGCRYLELRDSQSRPGNGGSAPTRSPSCWSCPRRSRRCRSNSAPSCARR